MKDHSTLLRFMTAAVLLVAHWGSDAATAVPRNAERASIENSCRSSAREIANRMVAGAVAARGSNQGIYLQPESGDDLLAIPLSVESCTQLTIKSCINPLSSISPAAAVESPCSNGCEYGAAERCPVLVLRVRKGTFWEDDEIRMLLGATSAEFGDVASFGDVTPSPPPVSSADFEAAAEVLLGGEIPASGESAAMTTGAPSQECETRATLAACVADALCVWDEEKALCVKVPAPQCFRYASERDCSSDPACLWDSGASICGTAPSLSETDERPSGEEAGGRGAQSEG